MIIGYFLCPKDVFHAAASEEPFQACAHEVDENTVILWASFQDPGHEARFRARAGVQALPDARSAAPLSKSHVEKLSEYGVQRGHTTLDVSAALEETAGMCMKVPNG